MKKIVVSLGIIGAVAAVVIGATTAYFSDTETSKGNTISAGTIDIAVDGQNPWSEDYSFALEDMKPSYVKYSIFTVKNVATNPVRVWKHIKNVETSDGIMSEPECTDGGGTWNPAANEQDDKCAGGNYIPKHDIDKVIEYDMYICEGDKSICQVDGDGKPTSNNWTIVIDKDDGITLRDIKRHYIYLGELEKNKKMTVVQSYHMKSDTGNWAQGDAVTFDIELLALQLNASGPNKTTLLLENKDPGDWSRITGDGRYGILTYETENDTFDYDLKVRGLEPDENYTLIYYRDCPTKETCTGGWPGKESIAITSFTTDANGNWDESENPDLTTDLPKPGDLNALGAKFWVVLSSDWDSGNQMMQDWHPDEYLFEYNLVRYEDTND